MQEHCEDEAGLSRSPSSHSPPPISLAGKPGGAAKPPTTRSLGSSVQTSCECSTRTSTRSRLPSSAAYLPTCFRYVAGDVGHVVVITDHPRDGIALALSEGHRLTLGVVSGATRKQLLRRTTKDKLRPASIERNGFSYLLLLRGEKGAEKEIPARRVVLTP
jgi:hypothetical protein